LNEFCSVFPDRTATQYEPVSSAIGIIMSSVRLSVMLYIVTQGWRTGLKVISACSYSSHVSICPFRHFSCKMYRLATKRTGKD